MLGTRAAVNAVEGSPDERCQGRNSLLGNGFHLPSLMAVLCLLPALLEAKLVPQPRQPDADLLARLVGYSVGTGAIELFSWHHGWCGCNPADAGYVRIH